MGTLEKIKIANSTGMYKFPFEPSMYADAIINDNITFEEFKIHPDTQQAQEYNGKTHKYTEEQKRSHWSAILQHRLRYRAIMLVIEGEFIAFNPALRSLK